MPYIAKNTTGGDIAIRTEEGKRIVADGEVLTDISKSIAMQARSRGFEVEWVQNPEDIAPQVADVIKAKEEVVEAKDEKPKRKATVTVSED